MSVLNTVIIGSQMATGTPQLLPWLTYRPHLFYARLFIYSRIECMVFQVVQTTMSYAYRYLHLFAIPNTLSMCKYLVYVACTLGKRCNCIIWYTIPGGCMIFLNRIQVNDHIHIFGTWE